MTTRLRSALLRPLQASLAVKLVGVQLIVIAAGVALAVSMGWRPNDAGELARIGVAATIGLPASIGLVALALRPLGQLEEVARRVSVGDYTARVPEMRLADPALRRLSVTFNELLGQVTNDRTRLRDLASEAIRSGDEERSRAAIKLHESSAQAIASVSWQLSAMARDVSDEELQHRLVFAKRTTEEVLEDIRQLAETMHPKVLSDLGLAAALSQLARQCTTESNVCVTAHMDRGIARSLKPSTAFALYRTAQEAVWNALRHGQPNAVRIWLFAEGPWIRLEVIDDGTGFDVKAAESNHRPGCGIFAMRDRLTLVDAQLTVESRPGGGTRVCARVHNHSAGVEKSA